MILKITRPVPSLLALAIHRPQNGVQLLSASRRFVVPYPSFPTAWLESDLWGKIQVAPPDNPVLGKPGALCTIFYIHWFGS